MNLSTSAKKNNTTNSSLPSKTPISITKHLSDLRLTHVQLLKEHHATTALLRRREAEVVDLERRENEARQTVETLKAGVPALKEKVGRRDHRAIILAEREAGFLRSLVVRHHHHELSIFIDPHGIEH
jgi:mitotic spindle assembly checkpoint protein MAD1